MLQTLIAIIIGAAITIGGWLGVISPEQQQLHEMETKAEQIQEQIDWIKQQEIFGAFNPVGGKYYYLAGSGIDDDDTSVVLRTLTYPITDYKMTMADFGTKGYATIEPGSTSKIEFISFTGLSYSGDKATLSGVSRGLSPHTPYTASTTLAQAHSGGSIVIFSNSPAFYSEFARIKNDITITGTYTFSSTSLPRLDYATDPTYDYEFVDKGYADALAIAGSPAGSTTTAGIYELTSTYELTIFGTTTGKTGKQLIMPFSYFATSTDLRGATTTAVLTTNQGQISQTFINRDEAFIWRHDHTFSSTTRFSASTTMSATTTIGNSQKDVLRVNASTTFNASTTLRNATTVFDRPPIVDSNSANATASDFYSLIKKGDMDAADKDALGAWTRNADDHNVFYASNTAYLASSTGMVCMSVYCYSGGVSGSCDNIRIQGMTDANNPPMRTIVRFGSQFNTATVQEATWRR